MLSHQDTRTDVRTRSRQILHRSTANSLTISPRPVPDRSHWRARRLANLRAHNGRLRRQVTKLARRLSEALGHEIFRASGLGDPDHTETLRRRVNEFEQTTADLRQQLAERTEELDAARATNRELMAEVNCLPGRWPAADKPLKRMPRR